MSEMTWRAKWLRAPLDAPGTRRRAFGRTLFRSSLTVAEPVPDDGHLRVSADSHYVLYVNGAEIARGPGRSQPRRKTHDRIDLSGVLRPGKNVLACVVTYFGRSNALWQQPVPSGELGAGASLIVDGQVGGRQMGNELVWWVRESSAWKELSGGKLDGIPSVVFDARELDPSWMLRDDDRDDWDVAVAVNTGHRGWMTEASPPAAPFGSLPEGCRGMEVVHRKGSLDAMVVSSALLPDSPHPSDHLNRLMQLDWDSARSGSDVSRVTLAEGQVLVIRADHERVVKGTFRADLEAPRGTTMDIAFSEQVDRPRDPLSSLSGHRYVARGSDDHVETHEAYGMRAAFLVVRPPSAGTVAVSRVSVSERLRPWARADRFRSDDPGLARLWTAGVRTTRLNSDGGFTDCPTREQRAWVGDGVVHAGVHLVANDDWSAVEEHLWLTDSPREDGILPMSVAGDLEQRDGVTIPTWSLHWVHTVWSFYMHAGIERVRPHLATARRILAWFAERRRGSGLLGETGEWDLVDWSAVYVRGDSGAVTALWVRALREFAEMCREASDAGSERWAASLADRASEAFELLWQPARGLYADFRVDDLPLTYSQVTNAAAICAGIASVDRAAAIAAKISDPRALVVRSLYAGSDGRVDTARWERISRRDLVFDWDLAREIVRAEPFLSAVVHDAYRVAGRSDLAVAALEDWHGIIDGDTYRETWNWGSPCHGWSSTPTIDIVRSVLGVSPIEAGYRRARIAPYVPEEITRVSGEVPTPHGCIGISLVEDEMSLSTPIPVCLERAGCAPEDLPPGTHLRRLDESVRTDTRTGRGTGLRR